MTASPTCPKCKRALPNELINQVELKRCHWCQTPVMVEIFPAMSRPIAAGSAAEALMMEGESGCFYHPEKKAVVPCEACGRFLCALCDCEVRGQHFCPSCLETGRKKGKMTFLENKRTRYDSIALALSIYPLLVWVVTLVTAPAALYFVIRYWNAPRSMVPTTRWRLVVALVLSSLQVVGWCLIGYFAFIANRRHG